MVSTLLILAVALSALVLAWSLLHRVHPEIRNRQDWDANRHEIDVEIFRTLLDRNQEHYLRSTLSHPQFQKFRRKRIRLALRMLRLVEENAGMLTRLGELARMKGDPALTEQANLQEPGRTLQQVDRFKQRVRARTAAREYQH